MPTLLLPLFASLLAQSVVHALRNITIDDSDSMITYTGDWRRNNSILDFGGSHAYTLDPEAQAVVTFIGVGVYFLSPRWPFVITMQLSLDDGPPSTLDLQDYITPFSDGSETTVSQITWNASGLTNGMHKLRAFPAPSNPYVIMDSLILTVLDDTDPTTDSPTEVGTSPTSLTSGRIQTSALPTPTTSSPTRTSTLPTTSSTTHARGLPTSTLTPRNVAVISAASVAGGITVLTVLAFVIFFIYKHFQSQRERDERINDIEAANGTLGGGGDGGSNGGAPDVSSPPYANGRESGTSSPLMLPPYYRFTPSGAASLATGAGSSQNGCETSHLPNSPSNMDVEAVPGGRPDSLDDLASSQANAGPLASFAVAPSLPPRAISKARRL